LSEFRRVDAVADGHGDGHGKENCRQRRQGNFAGKAPIYGVIEFPVANREGRGGGDHPDSGAQQHEFEKQHIASNPSSTAAAMQLQRQKIWALS
jgi:hypothetical protein